MASKLLARLRRREKGGLFCASGVKTASSPPYGYQDKGTSSFSSRYSSVSSGVSSATSSSYGYQDTEVTSSSGYSSASSADLSEEERRLHVDPEKVFQVCGRLDSCQQSPKCSTPIGGYKKNRSAVELRKRRTSLSSYRSGSSRSSLLSIKKTIREDKSIRRHVTLSDSAIVCDLSSRLTREESAPNLLSSTMRHDTVDRASRQDSSKRRPICEFSVEDVSPRQRSRSAARETSSDTPATPHRLSRDCVSRRQLRSSRRVLLDRPVKTEEYARDTLPRKRPASVQRGASSKRSPELSATTTDHVSVDESMDDFLFHVNKHNLVDFLTFYDNVTISASRRASCGVAEFGQIRSGRKVFERYV